MNTKSNKKLVMYLVGLPLFMLSMSFAAVPFYDWFCRVTGFGGVTQVAGEASTKVLDREIQVRFDGSLEKGMPWEFKPQARTMKLRIGETGLAFYEAHNPTDKPIAGTASFNVYPYSAGAYFTKIDCFCFELQVLQPGETVQMPVTFYVDPEIVDDIEGKYVNSITLSYTFHVTDLPELQASLDLDSEIDVETAQ
ncbi:cytochrome c oxidase assembly protein [Amylibacter sp. SFDW26]|uniref:cytochrome c oxidase assembly protein n=1 Tax=Amylibacter sp. SFDW26 TaxID=2652722 RepID=UPI0012620F79|nr:cytochrome c oxidase assembly protein [Amylibacter sp. SFDW26]KAB7610376.1 cytochrome c oxidase assembly protein [Amylibacter sp. SFDW26]